MTAEEVARHFNAKRIGRGKWMARCPAHDDRKPSLSIDAGKTCVLVRCMSMGCDTRDVIKASGLRMGDLRCDAGRKPTAADYAEGQRRRELEARADEYGLKLQRIKRVESMRQRGYNSSDMRADYDTALTVAAMLADDPKPHLERLLRVLMENVVAYHQGVL
jgi:hypothetical protein